MKKKWIGVLVVVLWAGLGMAAESPVQTGVGHPFACTDYTRGKVYIVSAQGQVQWEYQTGSCDDLWVLPNGNLLFNTHFGVAEVRRAKKVVWTFADHKAMSTVSSLQVLDVPGDPLKGEVLH